jgi:hypothetical protein
MIFFSFGLSYKAKFSRRTTCNWGDELIRKTALCATDHWNQAYFYACSALLSNRFGTKSWLRSTLMCSWSSMILTPSKINFWWEAAPRKTLQDQRRSFNSMVSWSSTYYGTYERKATVWSSRTVSKSLAKLHQKLKGTLTWERALSPLWGSNCMIFENSF